MSLLLAVLDLVDDLSPTIWAAVFLGILGLLLIVVRHDDAPTADQLADEAQRRADNEEVW